MRFFSKLFGGENKPKKEVKPEDIFEDIYADEDVVEKVEIDPDQKRLKEINNLLDFYQSDDGAVDESLIVMKTNVEVGRVLVESIHARIQYDGVGLFKVKDGILQHWSYIILQYMSLHYKDEYKEISERLNVQTIELRNENLNGHYPMRKLSEIEQPLLWHFYLTRVKLEDNSITTMSGVIASQVKNEIEGERVKQIEMLRVEQRELEIKINYG
jgi:hypothetical protein